jgi:hypothetical protein
LINIKTLKVLFVVLTTLMITSIIFGVMNENTMELTIKDRIFAGLFGSLMVVAINYVIYKFLSKIWK